MNRWNRKHLAKIWPFVFWPEISNSKPFIIFNVLHIVRKVFNCTYNFWCRALKSMNVWSKYGRLKCLPFRSRPYLGQIQANFNDLYRRWYVLNLLNRSACQKTQFWPTFVNGQLPAIRTEFRWVLGFGAANGSNTTRKQGIMAVHRVGVSPVKTFIFCSSIYSWPVSLQKTFFLLVF